MTIETIGTWAGEVYKALENSETRMLGLKGVKKATKLKKDELMAAFRDTYAWPEGCEKSNQT